MPLSTDPQPEKLATNQPLPTSSSPYLVMYQRRPHFVVSLAQARAGCRVTIRELSERLARRGIEISPSHLNRIENGIREITPELHRAIFAALFFST